MPKYERLPSRGEYLVTCATCGTQFKRELPCNECLNCRRKTHETGTPYLVMEVDGKTYSFNVRLFHMMKNKPIPLIVTSPYTVTRVDSWISSQSICNQK